MRNRDAFVRVCVAGVAVAGLLSQQACAANGPNPVPPGVEPSGSGAAASNAALGSAPASASASPTRTSGASPTRSAGGVFSGGRQVYLLPLRSEATFAVGKSGRVELSEDFGDRALFVLTPVAGDQFWIRTAKLRTGGEASCLGVEGRKVLAMPCDASEENQLFRFRKTGTDNGKPKYTIRTGVDTYLLQDPQGRLDKDGSGVVAYPIGEGTPDIDTPFFLPDRGKATMPSLD